MFVNVTIQLSLPRGDRQRAFWIGQELVDAFGDEGFTLTLRATITPTFEIRCEGDHVWARSREGGLPDAEFVKRRVPECFERRQPPKSDNEVYRPLIIGGKAVRGRSPGDRGDGGKPV